MAAHRKYFVGQIYTVSGGELEIVAVDDSKSSNCRYVWVMWLDEYQYVQRVRTDTLKTGNIGNPFKRTVEGFGYLGVGKHNASRSNLEKYNSWASMIARSKRKKLKEKYKTYDDCHCSVEWECYQNYGDFFENCRYRKSGWHLDKDLLYKGNKLYSSETCVYLPPELNSQRFYDETTTESGYKGVWYDPDSNRYMAQCADDLLKRKTLGRFNNPLSAARVVMKAESERFNYFAKKYEGVIDPRAVNCLHQISKNKLVMFN